MQCIVLCGGYAKRLWPVTKYMPKSLLDVGKKPLLDHTIEKIIKSDVKKIIISTNELFNNPFEIWLNEHKNLTVSLITEPTKAEEGKFGTIAGLEFVIDKKQIKDDLMVIAGDNLFEFEITDFVKFFKEKNGPIVAVYDVKDVAKASLYGVVDMDENNKILDFVEKPLNPVSTLAATACYIFPKEVLPLISEYLKEGNRKDSPGFFLSWLIKKMNVYAYKFNGRWFDIGDFTSLEKARKFMELD